MFLMQEGSAGLRPEKWNRKLTKAIMDIAFLLSRLIGEEITKAAEHTGIIDKIAMLLAEKRVEKELAPYLSAVILLTFVGKQSTAENVSRLLDVIGIKPNNHLLHFASSLDLYYKVPYVPALYFDIVMEQEITPENLVKTVSAMGNKADISTAADIIAANERVVQNGGESGKGKVSDMQKKLDEGIQKSASLIAKLMKSELDRVMQYKEVAANLDTVLPYVSTVGVLGFTGRDVAIEGADSFKKSMMALMASVGKVPDEKVADYVATKIGFGNFPFAYIPSLYFAISNGIEASIENVTKVLKAMGLPADSAVAGFICSFYEDNKASV